MLKPILKSIALGAVTALMLSVAGYQACSVQKATPNADNDPKPGAAPSGPQTPSPEAGPGPQSPLPAPETTKTCSYGGKEYKTGESFPASDGCNSCSCSNGEAACTLLGCVAKEPVDGIAFEEVTKGFDNKDPGKEDVDHVIRKKDVWEPLQAKLNDTPGEALDVDFAKFVAIGFERTITADSAGYTVKKAEVTAKGLEVTLERSPRALGCPGAMPEDARIYQFVKVKISDDLTKALDALSSVDDVIFHTIDRVAPCK